MNCITVEPCYNEETSRVKIALLYLILIIEVAMEKEASVTVIHKCSAETWAKVNYKKCGVLAPLEHYKNLRTHF